MGEYAKAAEDADKAMQGYTPASIADVSVPAFADRIAHTNGKQEIIDIILNGK